MTWLGVVLFPLCAPNVTNVPTVTKLALVASHHRFPRLCLRYFSQASSTRGLSTCQCFGNLRKINLSVGRKTRKIKRPPPTGSKPKSRGWRGSSAHVPWRRGKVAPREPDRKVEDTRLAQENTYPMPTSADYPRGNEERLVNTVLTGRAYTEEEKGVHSVARSLELLGYIQLQIWICRGFLIC